MPLFREFLFRINLQTVYRPTTGLSYTPAMHSEILFILFLIAPWVLFLAALLFYRKRRQRKAQNDSGDGDNQAGKA